MLISQHSTVLSFTSTSLLMPGQNDRRPCGILTT